MGGTGYIDSSGDMQVDSSSTAILLSPVFRFDSTWNSMFGFDLQSWENKIKPNQTT